MKFNETLKVIVLLFALYLLFDNYSRKSSVPLISQEPTVTFNVGDCVVLAPEEDPEAWASKKPNTYQKVLTVGKKKYLTYFYVPNLKEGAVSELDFIYAKYYTKVECPKALENVK